jgi:hypothetical protein
MASNFDISYDGALIQVRVFGSIDEDGIRQLWTAIVNACDSHDCYDILGVSNLDVPFSTMDAYSHSETFSTVGVTARHRIAWVDGNGRSRKMLEFTHTVLKNRGKLNGALFPSIEEAEQWLRAESGQPE